MELSSCTKIVKVKKIIGSILEQYYMNFGTYCFDILRCYQKLFKIIWFPGIVESKISLNDVTQDISEICIFMDSVSVSSNNNNTPILNEEPIGICYVLKYKDPKQLSSWNPLKFTEVSEDVIQTKEEIEKFRNEIYNEFMNKFWNWNNGVFRICRGLVLGINNIYEYYNSSKVITTISVPYQKFFNVGEFEEVSKESFMKKISDKDSLVEFVDKLDGSMITASYHTLWDKLIVCSMGSSDVTSPYISDATNYIINNPTLYNYIRQNTQYTFIFELINKTTSNVVLYFEDDYDVHIIGIVDKSTTLPKDYISIKKMLPSGVMLPDFYYEGVENIFNNLKQYKFHEKEGYVVNVNGFRYKLKCTDYVRMHKIISLIGSPARFVKYMLDGTLEEVFLNYPSLKEYFSDQVNNINHKFDTIDNCIESLFDKVKTLSKLTDVPDLSPYSTEEQKDLVRTFAMCIDATVASSEKPVSEALVTFKSHLILLFKSNKYNYKIVNYGESVKYLDLKTLERYYAVANKYQNYNN